jgi:putative hydrolase of the HAD superfamily
MYFHNQTLDSILENSSAVIFDYNGLIVDDEPLQLQAFNEVFKNFGDIVISEEEFIVECVGTRPREVFAHIFNKYRINPNNFNLDECVDSWRESRANIKINSKEIVRDGVLEIITFLSSTNKKIGLVSSSSRDLIEDSLEQLNLVHKFDTLVTSEDVSRGKPDPEPYLLASKQLQIPPSNCLVFEDTSSGVQSAMSAGMKCIAVPNRFTQGQNFSLASLVIDSLKTDTNYLGD